MDASRPPGHPALPEFPGWPVVWNGLALVVETERRSVVRRAFRGNRPKRPGLEWLKAVAEGRLAGWAGSGRRRDVTGEPKCDDPTPSAFNSTTYRTTRSAQPKRHPNVPHAVPSSHFTKVV